jgi:hypothetical protein
MPSCPKVSVTVRGAISHYSRNNDAAYFFAEKQGYSPKTPHLH